MPKGLTYKQAGVNISEANKFIGDIGPLVRTTFNRQVLTSLGGFGSCFAFPAKEFKNPVLVSSTDGVGTKLKIAMLADKHDTVGIDMVAMNVNDILAMGARPLFFLDYIAIGKVARKKLVAIVRGIVKGCQESGCSLIGGETAEMPVIYRKDEYDLAGFCVGVAEKNEIITGKSISAGDVLVGIESSGLHSNGFSLVHKVFSQREIKKRAAELLTPTRIYVKPVLAMKNAVKIKGIAHMTGGAYYEKLMRIIPGHCSVIVRKGSWPVPEIFSVLQQRGKVESKEMFRTFNMGIGLVVVMAGKDVAAAQAHLKRYQLRSWVIGEVVPGRSTITFVEGK